jgi:hypothetical protein
MLNRLLKLIRLRKLSSKGVAHRYRYRTLTPEVYDRHSVTFIREELLSTADRMEAASNIFMLEGESYTPEELASNYPFPSWVRTKTDVAEYVKDLREIARMHNIH